MRAGFSRLALGVTARRCYATAERTITLPTQVSGINGTYAAALYTATSKKAPNSLESIERAVVGLRNMADGDVKVSGILANPSLSSQDKKVIVDVLTRTVGESDRDIVRSFLDTVGANNRFSHLSGIVGEFERLMRARKGEVDVVITSATQLDHRTLARLESAIGKSQFIGQGKKIRMQNKVNESILGGLIVEIGDRTIDTSVGARLTKLNQLLHDSL